MDWTTKGAIGAGLSAGIQTYIKLRQLQNNEEKEKKESDFMEKNWKLSQDKFKEYQKTQEESRSVSQAQKKLLNMQINGAQFEGAINCPWIKKIFFSERRCPIWTKNCC